RRVVDQPTAALPCSVGGEPGADRDGACHRSILPRGDSYPGRLPRGSAGAVQAGDRLIGDGNYRPGADGSRAYMAVSGSGDGVVFDVSVRTPVDKRAGFVEHPRQINSTNQ